MPQAGTMTRHPSPPAYQARPTAMKHHPARPRDSPLVRSARAGRVVVGGGSDRSRLVLRRDLPSWSRRPMI
jgi:hypothetical protein